MTFRAMQTPAQRRKLSVMACARCNGCCPRSKLGERYWWRTMELCRKWSSPFSQGTDGAKRKIDKPKFFSLPGSLDLVLDVKISTGNSHTRVQPPPLSSCPPVHPAPSRIGLLFAWQ